MSHKMKRAHYADMFGPTTGDRIRLATVFAGVTILALWVAVGYWKVTGII